MVALAQAAKDAKAMLEAACIMGMTSAEDSRRFAIHLFLIIGMLRRWRLQPVDVAEM